MHPATDHQCGLPAAVPEQRFVFIDALRGVACVGVLLAHLLGDTIMSQPLVRILPRFLQSLIFDGTRGVQIFFVISGFVIAYSLRDFVPTVRTVGRFVVRRQLRLDPPYWAAVAVCLAIALAEHHVAALHRGPLPGATTVGLNLLYLQNVTGRFEVLPVAWTLCIEIQFYAVFVAILCLARLTGWRDVAALTVAALAVFSIATAGQFAESPWFVPYWAFFAIGAVCHWTLARKLPPMILGILLCGWAAVAGWTANTPAWAGIATAAAVYAVGRFHRLTRWSGGPVLQYLGSRSYSLYLVHVPVLSVVLRGAYKLTGANQIAALGWFAVTPLLCLLAAEGFYRFVEQPSLRVSRAIGGRRSVSRIAPAVPIGPACLTAGS
jgi:peptidoglycan/LPS O-acetylase OafA/YrhL